jgi:hypothetical protein
VREIDTLTAALSEEAFDYVAAAGERSRKGRRWLG